MDKLVLRPKMRIREGLDQVWIRLVVEVLLTDHIQRRRFWQRMLIPGKAKVSDVTKWLISLLS
jgi:hypothetical protein